MATLHDEHREQSTDRPPPVAWPFIIGVPRSGTTLLRLMLDSHPEVAIPPESHFFHELVGRDLAAMSRAEFYGLITQHFTWRDFCIDDVAFDRALDGVDPFSVADGLRALYRLYAARFGKARWGEKTPDYGLLMPEIAALLPEARFVHLIRDGRDVALSRQSLWFGPGTDIAAQAEDWMLWIRRVRNFGAGSEHYLEIRYEALVTSSDETLREVCRFLQLPFRKEMLSYHAVADARLAELKGWKTENVTADQLRGIQELTARPPTPDRIDRWKREMPPEALRAFEDVAGPFLTELGYEVAAGDRSGIGAVAAASLFNGVRRTGARPTVSALLLTHDIPDEAIPWLMQLRAVVDEFVVLVDSQLASERTRARVAQVASRTKEFAPNGVAEAFLSEGVKACKTDWILRLDSDEELSIEWQDGAWRELLTLRDYTHFRIPRRWCPRPGSYIPVQPWFPDYQIRLFRNEPANIRFGTTIHGVMEIPGRYAYTRSLAIHHHVLWLLSRTEREEKVQFYNTLPGGGLSHYYLYEDFELPETSIPHNLVNIDTELLRMGMLSADEVRAIRIEVCWPTTECYPAQLLWPSVRIYNATDRVVCSYPPFPVNLAYHWIEADSGRTVIYDGDRTPLLPVILPNESIETHIIVIAPSIPSDYMLQITLVQENIRWFEEQNRNVVQEFPFAVRERSSAAA